MSDKKFEFAEANEVEKRESESKELIEIIFGEPWPVHLSDESRLGDFCIGWTNEEEQELVDKIEDHYKCSLPPVKTWQDYKQKADTEQYILDRWRMPIWQLLDYLKENRNKGRLN